MKQGVYTCLTILLGLLAGLLLLIVSGGHLLEGEAAMGAGLLWYYSLPAFLLFGLLAGRTTYSWYCAQDVVLVQAAILLCLALAVAVMAPVVTYAALYMLSLW